MDLVFIPAGDFLMGTTFDDIQTHKDEIPRHKVGLDAYWIDRTEITNAMYNQCISADRCSPPARSRYFSNPDYETHPVIGVSWDQANAYCAWANRRLPTEAEWEKAARGTDERAYPWGNSNPTSELLNFNQNVGETSPVGMYPRGASPYGVLDMAGNAWEWVQDGYTPDYYATSPKENPLSLKPVNQRVLRGGNWDSNADGVRSTNRFWAFPGRNDTDGFRCAKSN